MTLRYPALLAAMFSTSALATDIFINEIHYDNASTDSGEFIEVVAPQGTDLSAYSVVLYNGNNGNSYNTLAFSTPTSTEGGKDIYDFSLPSNGIQNGSPDGLALIADDGSVVQFLSYEGTFIANDGAATGTESTDIGVSETSSTPVGASLQLAGQGTVYTDFTWVVRETNTQGAINEEQTFSLPQPFINEIHYDNDGGDTGEFIEVAGQAGLDLTGYTLVLYNGNGGSSYDTVVLSGVIPDADNGYGVIAFAQSGIQNGGPDGLALVDPLGVVVQFLSYEGSFTAVGGPADGMVSEDIGVAESGSTPVGYSLQLAGTGTAYSQFSWQTPMTDTFDAVNTGQSFGSGDDGGDDGGNNGGGDDGDNNGGGDTGDITGLFINEFHYDNVSTDTGEMVEIAGPAGTDLSGVTVVLYNGNGGGAYETLTFSGSIPDQQNGFGTVFASAGSLQNGNDAIALVVGDTVVEFISYEGEVEATEGPAAGMTSVDLSVSETSSTPVGYSLQKVGSGNKVCSFVWTDPSPESPGNINTNQTFTVEDDAICSGDDNGLELGQCGDDATFISQVQGAGYVTPFNSQDVIIEGVVSAVFPALNGFYIQEEAADYDANDNTSEGVFVYTGTSDMAVSEGRVVRLSGSAGEFNDVTQVSLDSEVLDCGAGSVTPVVLSLPVDQYSDFESLEGMLVESGETWTISGNFNYFSYNELIVSNGRLYNPTQLYLPGTEEQIAASDEYTRNHIIVDDDANGFVYDANTDSGDWLLPVDGLSPYNPVRAGDEISNVTGVVGYGFGEYRIYTVTEPQLARVNVREDLIVEDGNLRVASFNVLNLFNGDGNGGGFPTERGADTYSEYERQLAKIINALDDMNADVLGLIEVENDGFGEDSTLAQLVDELNAAFGPDTYAYIDVSGNDESGLLGTDAIMSAIIYRPSVVTPVGAPKVLMEANAITDEYGSLFRDRGTRPSVAQLFKHAQSEREFVFNVNHLRSKGSSCNKYGIPNDDSVVQGNCNLTRTRAATAVSVWLEDNYANVPVVIVGDLNAYAKEDPITEFESFGYINTVAAQHGNEAYSYSFDAQAGTLDYLLVNAGLNKYLVDVQEWNINTDEVSGFDYNEEYKPESWLNTLPYRASDHDPVVGSLQLTLLGDRDGDFDVDQNDIKDFMRAVVRGQVTDMEYDFSGDGRITARDVAYYRRLCTVRGCRVQ